MSALAVEYDYLCACGCGEELNPMLRVFSEAAARGRTHAKIAAEHGFTREYVSSLLRKPPRFVKGHSSVPAGPRPIRNCDNCGEPYKQQGPGQLHCTKPICHWMDHERRVLAPWRESQERIQAKADRKQTREKVLALLKRDPDWEARERDYKTLRRSLEGELDELVEQQEKDDRFGHITFSDGKLSFDAHIRGQWGAEGPEYHELRPTQEGVALDPALMYERELDAERVYAIAGTDDIDAFRRMEDSQLQRIQDRLRDEGLVHRDVQASESARLQEHFVQHSGSNIAKSKPHGGGHRGRREASALLKGKRTSRTPRKRWKRERYESYD